MSSALWHCIDGWSYVGRALSAHSHSDIGSALHLAYYAELRAAMALLGSEGIGILNNRHFVLDANGAPSRLGSPTFRPGTHLIAWDALTHWASLHKATDLLAEVLRPAGVPISQWFSGPVASLSVWRPVAADWLTSLGVDLRMLPQDRAARNQASYRPSGIAQPQSLDVQDSLSFITEFWRLFEPSPASPFDRLDRYLLRSSLEESYQATGQLGSSVSYEDFVDSALAAGLAGSTDTSMTAFLRREVQSENPKVLDLAARSVEPPTSTRHLQVIARAAILLRIATGSWKLLMDDADITSEEMTFAWSRFGESRGFWAPDTHLDSCFDLWSEVQDALNELEDWRLSVDTNDRSFFSLSVLLSGGLRVLAGCERIPLWSLA